MQALRIPRAAPVLGALAASFALAIVAPVSRAGELNPPPGPVGSSMVTLSEIDSAVRGLAPASSSCPAPPQAIPAEMGIWFDPISVGPIQGDEIIGGIPGASRALSAKGGQRRSGETSLGDFVIVKQYDAASPKLFLACCNGEHIPKVEIRMFRAAGGGGSIEYMAVELENAFITSYSFGTASGSGGDQVPMEEITINFAKMTVKYTQTGEKTSATQGGPGQWFPPGPSQ